MDISRIKQVNGEIQDDITAVKKIITNYQNGNYSKEPWRGYSIDGFKEKDNIHSMLYKKMFDEYDFLALGKQTLKDKNLKDTASIEFSSNSIFLLSYYIAINHCTVSTIAFLRYVFSNDFPLLEVLRYEYTILFEEILKTENNKYLEFKSLLFDFLYKVTDKESFKNKDPKNNILLQWFSLKIDLISKIELGLLSRIYKKFLANGYFEKPPTENHWIRGLVRQIEFKWEMVNKKYIIKKKQNGYDSEQLKKIISIHSRKGGVGKTTVATLLAKNLVNKNGNKRVCIVDFDTHGPTLENIFKSNFFTAGEAKLSLTDYLLIDEYQGFNFSDLYERIKFKKDDKDYLTLIKMSARAGDIDAVNVSYRKEPNLLLSDFEQRLHYFFKNITNEFDHIIVDTHPGLWGISREILTLNYNFEGTLVFVASPTIYDLVGYGYEFKQLEDLPGFSDFKLIINKIEPETYKKIFAKNITLKKLLEKQIEMFPSSVDQNSYLKTVKSFIDLIPRTEPNYVQVYDDLIHLNDITLNYNKKTLGDELNIKTMQETIDEIVIKVV